MKARNSSPGIFMRKAIVRTKKDHRVPSNLTSFSLISQCLFCFVFFFLAKFVFKLSGDVAIKKQYTSFLLIKPGRCFGAHVTDDILVHEVF